MGWLSDLKRRLRRDRLTRQAPTEVFQRYYRSNKWGDRESRSGKGSNLAATAELRPKLSALLAELEIGLMLDVPCGDFHWMAHVDLGSTRYLGGDIVPDLIADTARRHARDGVAFKVIDLISGPVPRADLVFVRDCLVHLSNDHVRSALKQIRVSGSTFLLTTTFPEIAKNEDIATGEWRAVNLTLPPFSLPPPLRLIAEGAADQKGQGTGKMLGLWRISDITGTD
jgi:SAM-dependent methyltransferase